MARPAKKADGPDTKERVLAVAEKLFAEKGFHGASLRDIGGEVGIANASLLYHFPSKGKLYVAVLDRITESLSTVAGQVERAEMDDVARFELFYNAFYDWGMAHADYLRIVMREMMDNKDRVDRIEKWHLTGVMGRMTKVIADGQARGTFRACNPELFLYQVLGSVTYFQLGLPTLGRVMDWDRAAAEKTFRRQALEHLSRALVKKSALKKAQKKSK